MGPPDELTPSELVRELSKPRPSKVWDFPRKGVKTRIRMEVIRLEDHDVARLQAWEDAVTVRRVPKEREDSPAVDAVYRDATALRVLSTACKEVEPISEEANPPNYARVFPNVQQMRDLLSADELVALYNLYLITQHQLGPNERFIGSDADLDAWVMRLVEGMDESPLSRLTLPHLVELCMSLATRVYALSESLDSQYWSSRSTLASDRGSSSSGTDSYGGQPNASSIGSGSSSTSTESAAYSRQLDREEAAIAAELQEVEELTPEQAAEKAKRIAKGKAEND